MDHYKLKSIMAALAKWRETDGAEGARANLAGADLADANLAGADLAGANLAGANLARAYLAGAYLAGAYLAGADLAGAYLADADLAGADLAGANLAGADLAGADLAGANLAGADLAGAYLAGANLADADLARANLAGANLAGAKGIQGHDPSTPEADAPEVPKIDRLNTAILAAIEGDSAAGKLDMSRWHSCSTTHCLAGWAVHLAGEPGYALEKRFGPRMAGAMIFRASTGSAPHFFAPNDRALKQLRERAAKESST